MERGTVIQSVCDLPGQCPAPLQFRAPSPTLVGGIHPLPVWGWGLNVLAHPGAGWKQWLSW